MYYEKIATCAEEEARNRKRWFGLLVSGCRLRSCVALGPRVGHYVWKVDTSEPEEQPLESPHGQSNEQCRCLSDPFPEVLKSAINRSCREKGGTEEEGKGKEWLMRVDMVYSQSMINMREVSVSN